MQSEIENSLSILKKGETLLYPTDTVWGIGCDATNYDAVSKVYEIKNRVESKSLVVLVNSLEMLSDYVKEIPLKVIEVLHKSTSPTTIIYNNPIGFASNCVASDNTIAIRIVKNEFCKQLIHQFAKPIVSTSANISGNPTPKSFSEIDKAILDSVDYVVNLHREEINSKSSTILKVNNDGSVLTIRK